jgi:DNA repair protein RadC
MEQVEATQEKEYIYAPVIHLQIVRDGDMKAPRYIHRPAHVAQLLMEHYGSMDREVVVVVHLDTRMQIVSVEPIATGRLNSANVNMRDLFKGAILSNAASIILAHNHPSGVVSPSPEDVAMTRKVKQAGDLLGVEVLDHLVVGYQDFASLKELGLMD